MTPKQQVYLLSLSLSLSRLSLCGSEGRSAHPPPALSLTGFGAERMEVGVRRRDHNNHHTKQPDSGTDMAYGSRFS